MHKIAIILSHPLNHVSGEIREAKLVESLLTDNLVSFFRVAEKGIKNIVQGEKNLLLFESDNPEDPVHEQSSKRMIDSLCQIKPDLIIFKGMNYKIVKDIYFSDILSQSKFSFIIGGEVDYELLLNKRTLIFEEYPNQVDRSRIHKSSLVKVADKYIDGIELIDSFDSREIISDIINVGNFDEQRKNQELLIPLLETYKVTFVGGGKRLHGFQELLKNNSNAEFVGHLSHLDTLKRISRSKLMVHCSLYEGLPRCVAESISLGTPVIWYRPQKDSPAPSLEGLFITSSLGNFFWMIECFLKDFKSLSIGFNKDSNHECINKLRDDLNEFLDH